MGLKVASNTFPPGLSGLNSRLKAPPSTYGVFRTQRIDSLPAGEGETPCRHKSELRSFPLEFPLFHP